MDCGDGEKTEQEPGMNGIATGDGAFRSDLFKKTADKMEISPVLVEKDFWVCWTLSRLFCSSLLKGHIIFKGGGRPYPRSTRS